MVVWKVDWKVLKMVETMDSEKVVQMAESLENWKAD